jgi:hypothetical protein
MPTFIAYNHNNYPISIVVAKNKDLANAYWHGANTVPHNFKCVEEDFTKLEDHPTGVFPILSTREKEVYEFRELKNDAIIIQVLNK